ncbi:30S ribosomal protein S20 [Lacticigenium naphthae]|uniref:30S ribosomal protein S20 n=1 Tax=Lacticigenium naphthae TaxID=515351 RepID=UPI0004273A38|nr:30S ribosomal protein S20 [Lacticigenium naphthae]
MPNIESAVKRNRQSEKTAAQHVTHVSAMRTAKKKFLKAAEANDDNANELYRKAKKAIDMAASKGLIHKNKASRDKSRLSSKLSK